jgi:hypothetical protein
MEPEVEVKISILEDSNKIMRTETKRILLGWPNTSKPFLKQKYILQVIHLSNTHCINKICFFVAVKCSYRKNNTSDSL